jgi:GntR family transcriptional regulator of arabinose operon
MPKYMDVAAVMKDEITGGTYAEGQILPTEEELSGRFGCSRQTVRQALSLLVDDDLIVKRQGSGSMVKRRQQLERTNNIAVIATYISDYIFPSQLRAVESVLAANKYTAILAATGNRVCNERTILKDMLSKPVDGFLIEGTKTAMPNPNLDLYEELMRRSIPVVFFNGYYPNLSGTVAVSADNFGGGYELVTYLMKKGHRRIAGIFKSDDIQGHQRYSGYISALRDADCLVSDEKIFWYTTESLDYIFRDSDEILSRLGDATAVVCYNDEAAYRLVQFLLKSGRRVPEDVAVVSFDNSSLSDVSPVRITSLSYEDRNIGRISAAKLIKLINGKTVESEAVPWTLVEKESG